MTRVIDWHQTHDNLDPLDRDLIAAHVLKVSRAHIIAHPELNLSKDTLELLNRLARRRDSGEPVAYLTGHKDFWHTRLNVTPDVLIPRPDSELLVELVLELAAPGCDVLELGTGSGAIAIALAEQFRVTATDISTAALKVAAENACTNGQNEVRFIAADWFDGLRGTFDVIVSNPPYVPLDDPHLTQLEYEPRQALVAGPDGLSALRHITAHASGYLKPRGWLVLEHGVDQGDAVRELCRSGGFERIDTACDLAGRPRATFGQLRPNDD